MTRRATTNEKPLDAFLAAKTEIDAMLERLSQNSTSKSVMAFAVAAARSPVHGAASLFRSIMTAPSERNRIVMGRAGPFLARALRQHAVHVAGHGRFDQPVDVCGGAVEERGHQPAAAGVIAVCLLCADCV